MVSENKLPDIDIDMKNREDILSIISTIPASKVNGTKITPHNTGVYFQNIPTEPFRGLSSIDYQRAEELGYIKVDFLNLSFLNNFSSNTEIDQLLEKEPVWELLESKEVVSKLFHLGNHFHIVEKIKPKSVLDLAICVALKMPGKAYLVYQDIDTIKSKIWIKEDGIQFKKSHSIAYATVIKLQLLLLEKEWLENSK